MKNTLYDLMVTAVIFKAQLNIFHPELIITQASYFFKSIKKHTAPLIHNTEHLLSSIIHKRYTEQSLSEKIFADNDYERLVTNHDMLKIRISSYM